MSWRIIAKSWSWQCTCSAFESLDRLQQKLYMLHLHNPRSKWRFILILVLNFVYFVICGLCNWYLLRFLHVFWVFLHVFFFGNRALCNYMTCFMHVYILWKLTSIWVKVFAIYICHYYCHYYYVLFAWPESKFQDPSHLKS